ncbi:MAG: carbonic anhydrase, partial [Methyloglobulus sp.]|nr:carbonic anhydrase [Methyloglobulus sp.]
MNERTASFDCNCHTTEQPSSVRRNFILSSALLGAGVLAGCSSGNVASKSVEDSNKTAIRNTALTKERRDALSPDDLIKVAKEGNERFRKGEQQPRDFLAEQQTSAHGQHPAAVLLTCIDSRAPAEILLDLGIGDVFNSRVAGNIINEDILGSMEFACELSGAKLVVVMGHTACGAIKGAINNAVLGNLTGLLAKIKPAVDATVYEGERTANNYDFVNTVARTNIEFAIRDIRT